MKPSLPPFLEVWHLLHWWLLQICVWGPRASWHAVLRPMATCIRGRLSRMLPLRRRDEDHLALFMELLGPLPRRVWGAGKLSREFFTRHGTLRHIRKLRHWPLDRVLAEKYEMPAAEARDPVKYPAKYPRH